MTKISFHGAAGTVTGSCYFLQHGNHPGLVVDCGMYQGPQEIQDLNQEPLGFNPADAEAVLLTHAHLDHCGRLPLLTMNGFKGKIYMTEPTRDLIEVVLLDAAGIAEREDDVYQMYTEQDVHKLLDHAEIISFNEPFEVGPYGVTYREAGHILGAASIEIVLDKPEKGFEKVVFSGDLGNYPNAMLPDPHRFDSADVVIMESTYGGRIHPDDRPKKKIQHEINEIEKNGGALLIPCFSIERTQEVLYIIKQLKDDAKVKLETSVFLDSPMAIRTTEIYRRYGGLYNDSFHDIIVKTDPFSFKGFSELMRAKEGRKIKRTHGPKVIIAGSGMMTGGRILKHAMKYLRSTRNRLLFTGYQGEETLGRAIIEGKRHVQIYDRYINIKSHVSKIEDMSAHADENQLLDWLKTMNGIKKLILTHGDNIPREALAARVKKDFKSVGGYEIKDIHTPELHDELLISA